MPDLSLDAYLSRWESQPCVTKAFASFSYKHIKPYCCHISYGNNYVLCLCSG